MGTHAAIAIKKENGLYDLINIACDGYVEGVGKTLLNHYNNYELASKIIELGDLYKLGSKLDKPTTFDVFDNTQTISFARDWETTEYGENRELVIYEDCTLDETKIAARCNFAYLYTFAYGKWVVFDRDKDTFQLLSSYQQPTNNLLPPITAYANYLSEASTKFGISINECRNRYGKFTVSEWETLLSETTPV